jgi:hypothetical protein
MRRLSGVLGTIGSMSDLITKLLPMNEAKHSPRTMTAAGSSLGKPDSDRSLSASRTVIRDISLLPTHPAA